MNNRIFIVYLTILVSNFIVLKANASSNQLELVNAIPINSTEVSDLSGLAYCEKELVAVSDKNDNVIFKIDEKQGNATPFIAFTSIPDKPFPQQSLSFKIKKWLGKILFNTLYDWEGISCDQQGNFYLVSETFIDVLKVNSLGVANWMNFSAFDSGYEAGFFKKSNFLEGVVWNDNQQFIMAIERAPRGIMTANKTEDNLWKFKYHHVNDSLIAPQAGRQADFTGMAIYQSRLLTLERNASAICMRDIKDFSVKNCWSYKHIENASEYRYKDNRYGIGEGITIGNGMLYIVVDNNGDTRVKDVKDRRPQLFKFLLPVFFE